MLCEKHIPVPSVNDVRNIEGNKLMKKLMIIAAMAVGLTACSDKEAHSMPSNVREAVQIVEQAKKDPNSVSAEQLIKATQILREESKRIGRKPVSAVDYLSSEEGNAASRAANGIDANSIKSL